MFILHHANGAAGAIPGIAAGTIGSPLYDIAPGHELAVAAVAVLPVVAWIVRTQGGPRVTRLVSGYAVLSPVRKLCFWLLASVAAVHVGLAIGHGGPGLRLLFLLDAALLAEAARRLALGLSWRVLAAAVLLGSLVAYPLAMVGGQAPDQIGLATKLMEVTALAIVSRPAPGRRVRGWAASGVTILLVVLTGLSGWVGAFAAAGGVQAHEHDQGVGSVPAPGTSLSASIPAAASVEQVSAARLLLEATRAAIARYADPAVAARDGYAVDGIAGLDSHASNEAYEHDDRVLDPERPESLVYAMGTHGPILLGAMFQMPGFGEVGPAVGGPLTVWHGHEQICFSLVPPGLTGIVSPLGGCPVGSLSIPRTVEMMHVWTVPGAPQPFGDLDDAWRDAYVKRAGS